jgi:DNA-binding MarR family transcriptional regulator
MGYQSDPQLRVLHALRVKHFADVAEVSEMTGLPAADVERQLEAASGAGLAERRNGPVRGWALTGQGHARHAELLGADVTLSGAHEVVAAAGAKLARLDDRFDRVCTDWYLRTAGPDQAPNDHRDQDYDRTVITALGTLDRDVQPICRTLAEALARTAPYGPRIRAALTRVQGGQRDAVARPLANSYRDAWAELRTDLLATLEAVPTGGQG